MNIFVQNLKLAFFLLIYMFSFPGVLWALQCDGKIVELGDKQRKVLQYCGKPTSIYREVEEHIFRDYEMINGDQDKYIEEETTEDSPDEKNRAEKRLIRTRHSKIYIEKWFYNLGEHKFTRELVFRDKVLSKITLGSYGFSSSGAVNRLIALGDSKAVVHLKEGEPLCKDTSIETYTTINYLDQKGLRTLERIFTLRNDEWIYPGDHDQSVRILTFRNNRLTALSKEWGERGKEMCSRMGELEIQDILDDEKN